MTNEEKSTEISEKYGNGTVFPTEEECIAYSAAMKMAEWKDQQMMELWNVVRNVYEAWMGGTMNDVRECMKDPLHEYDEFKDKGMY